MTLTTYTKALNDALLEEMTRDERVLVWGEDVATANGAFKVTADLLKKFGSQRVRDTPIAEGTIIGMAVGAALAGYKPVPEIMFSDFISLAMDQIVNQMAKAKYMSNGQAKMSVVIRSASGAGLRAAAQHSQTLHSWFANVPGLKVVLPATPADAKGLLKASIRDEDPVLFFEHKGLYNLKGEVPDNNDFIIPLGQASVMREGSDVSIIATQLMVHHSLKAADQLAEKGISIEVINLRTLIPLDKDTIINSVKKTNRVLVVDESNLTGGIQAELATLIMEEAFDYLDAPVKRLGVPDAPMPQSPNLEDYLLPNPQKIVSAVEAFF